MRDLMWQNLLLMCELEAQDVDQVKHLCELHAKDEGRYAGLKRARNARCAFQERMEVVDASGTKHRLVFQKAHTLSKGIQRHATSKWPSKTALHRERAWDRDLKAKLCTQENLLVGFFTMDDFP